MSEIKTRLAAVLPKEEVKPTSGGKKAKDGDETPGKKGKKKKAE
jgi:hypothetical protein